MESLTEFFRLRDSELNKGLDQEIYFSVTTECCNIMLLIIIQKISY